MLVLEGGLALVALLLGAVFGVAPFLTLSISARGLVQGLLATVPMLAMFVLLSRSRARFVHEIRERVDEAVALLFSNASVFQIAMVCVAAGFGEEALFRGFLQGALESWLGRAPALLLASAVFGVAHPVTPAYAAIATVIGLYFGFLWVLSGNLLAPIVAHGLYDFVAVLAVVRRRRLVARTT